MKFDGWAISAITGLILIILQLLTPDLVPTMILDALERDTSQFIGLSITLQAFLLIYIIGGWISFFVGVIGWASKA